MSVLDDWYVDGLLNRSRRADNYFDIWTTYKSGRHEIGNQILIPASTNTGRYDDILDGYNLETLVQDTSYSWGLWLVVWGSLTNYLGINNLSIMYVKENFISLS
jgi:hypothetical protein